MTMKQWPVAMAVAGAFVAGAGVHELVSPALAAHAAGEPGVRDPHLHRAARKARGLEDALPRPHHQELQQARHDEHRAISSRRTRRSTRTRSSTSSPTRAAKTAKKNWAAFNADPEWVKAKAESEADGKIVEKAVSVFADPADFSPIK